MSFTPRPPNYITEIAPTTLKTFIWRKTQEQPHVSKRKSHLKEKKPNNINTFEYIWRYISLLIQNIKTQYLLTKSAGFVEYTDCFSGER